MDQKRVVDLLNPIRIKIIQSVMQKGETTSKELSEMLPDVAIASLYRHIKKLIEMDVLEIVSETQIRGTVERLFRVKHNPFEAIEESMASGDASVHFQIFYSFLMSQLTDFSKYTASPYDMKADMVGFRTYPLYMDEDECMAFFGDLGALFEKYFSLEPNDSRKLRKFSFTMMPVKE